jgi:hypothetical protein
VHAAAVYAHHRLGQKAGRVAHVGRDLAAEQLIELDLVGCGNHLAVAVVDLELAGRNFRVIFLVLEAHRPLHLGGGVDELAQWIERQRVVVPAGVDELELACLVEFFSASRPSKRNPSISLAAFSVHTLLGVLAVAIVLQHAAQVARVGLAAFVDHGTENQHLAGAKYIGRDPVKGAPVDAEAQVALFLRRKSADGGAVKGQVVVAVDQELLVVIQQVERPSRSEKITVTALMLLLVRQVLDALFAYLVNGHAVAAFGLGL